jgi:hypothetical protein
MARYTAIVVSIIVNRTPVTMIIMVTSFFSLMDVSSGVEVVVGVLCAGVCEADADEVGEGSVGAT